MPVSEKTKIPLNLLQQGLKCIITDHNGVSEDLRNKSFVLQFINRNKNINVLDRLNIYAEAYFSRILECLENQFPITKNICGEHIFKKFVVDYLKEFPSKNTNIDNVGKDFPRFLKKNLLLKEFIYISDLAKLEWACVKALFAGNQKTFELNDLKFIKEKQWPNVRFKLASSVQFMRMQWPVPTGILVLCLCGNIVIEEINLTQYKVLQLMVKNKSLEEIAEFLLEKNVQISSLMDWFKHWTEIQLFAKLYF